jgi:hypothetical protein
MLQGLSSVRHHSQHGGNQSRPALSSARSRDHLQRLSASADARETKADLSLQLFFDIGYTNRESSCDK